MTEKTTPHLRRHIAPMLRKHDKGKLTEQDAFFIREKFNETRADLKKEICETLQGSAYMITKEGTFSDPLVEQRFIERNIINSIR